MYEIEKGIERPKFGGGPAKYPWRDMEVGDSFFTPDGNARSIVTKAGKANGCKFSSRKVEGGYRIWRIA